MTLTHYEAKVIGQLWMGCKGSTIYRFPAQPTKQQVLETAGDFARVTSIQLKRINHSITSEAFAN